MYGDYNAGYNAGYDSGSDAGRSIGGAARERLKAIIAEVDKEARHQEWAGAWLTRSEFTEIKNLVKKL
jgi:diphthamide synthase (EF-2-diphthine--ammonia ligase)